MKKYRNYIIFAILFLAFCISVCFVPISASKLIPMIETQISEELGIKVHMEKLILRLGPSVKLKAPVIHLMYQDGQKFGQLDTVKIFIPYSNLLKNQINVKKINANNIILKFNSNDKYFPDLMGKIQSRSFEENPNITSKKYSITYRDANTAKRYKLAGSGLSVNKLEKFKNYKITSNGDFFINEKKYITYDISVTPNITFDDKEFSNIDFAQIVNQLEELDFHSDLMADLKIYNDLNGIMQVSGLVNIDNISVLDKEKRNPRSFIYLTFFGNKVGILSNVYATGENKVCIDGTINNNSKKPEIDLKVKTDKINLSDLYSKLKLILDCSRFKGIESVSGNLVADFNLKGDLNKIKSSGYLKLSDAELKAQGINIKKIKSDIDFSNNVINITNATGYVNNSPIMLKGTIDKKLNLELLMDKVELKNLIPPKYGVNNGTISLVAKIGGTPENIQHKENLQIENLNAKNDNFGLSLISLKYDTNKENAAHLSNLIISTKELANIKLPYLRLLISDGNIKIPETNIFLPNSKSKLSAEISDYDSRDCKFNIRLNGVLNSRDIERLKSYSMEFPLNINISGDNNQQNFDAQILLEKAIFLDEPSVINLSAKYENDILKIIDLSVTDFSGKFADSIKKYKGQKKVIVSGNIENIAEPVMKNIRLFIPQQLNISFNDTVAQIKGDLFVNGRFKEPEILGQINVQNFISHCLQLTASDLTADFNKNTVVLNAPNVKLSDSSFGINAVASTDITKEILIKNLSVKSKYTNFDTILMYKDTPLMTAYPVKVQNGKYFADKATMTVYGSPLAVSALNTDFNLINNYVNANNISAEMYNGKLAANLVYNLKDDSYKIKLQGRGISASPIFDVVSPQKDSVSGAMDFDTTLSGNINTKQSLTGNIKFIVRNGHIGTLGKLEHLIYAQNVISDSMLRTSLSVVTKALTLKDTGLFKYLQGDIELSDGIANITKLQSQGPQMSLFIKGKYNILTDYAKLTVLGRISDEIVTGLGTFGDFSLNKLMIMLTGEENKYNLTYEDFDKLPQLPMRNTKEFRSIINGIIDRPSSVILFNWISYSQKSYRQKEASSDNKLPDFIDALPY